MEQIIREWHRRPEETDRAYRAFNLYLNQPPPRSLNFVRNAGYSPTSVNKWKNEQDWIKRSIAYDNYRADSIMDKDVGMASLYQQKVTEAGLEDMQLLRGMWMEAAQLIQQDINNREEQLGDERISAAQIMSSISTLAKARLDIDKLSRLAARMPDTHKPLPVAEDLDTFPNDVVELTFGTQVRSISDEVEEVVIEYGDESDEETVITE